MGWLLIENVRELRDALFVYLFDTSTTFYLFPKEKNTRLLGTFWDRFETGRKTLKRHEVWRWG
jgi:hypothetical protein